MLNIVVGDDDPAVRASLQSRLESAGHTVRTAADGAAVLSEVRERLPDLVITDIVMPGKEGIETIMELRKHHPALKILAISGGGRAGRVGYLGAAADLGADAVLAKPFTTRQLLDAIAQLGLTANERQA